MYRRLFILPIVVLCTICLNTYAQQTVQVFSDGGGIDFNQATQCLTGTQRTTIVSYLKKNVAMLQAKGLLQSSSITQSFPTVRLGFPLKQAPGFNDPGFHAISNYIDEDATTNVLDFNCGNRTYDGHLGTDFFIWPFWWAKFDNKEVQIVAATDGTIIGKSDGNYDKDCAFCTTCNWNAVYVQNTDGSICWYGHMKTGSLTTKAVGAKVKEGEFLGNVGSSGNSTGPHLHLEVYSDGTYQQLIDPWQGACNKKGNPSPSMWKTQENYYVPTINKVATENAAPVISQCYGSEKANFADSFNPGKQIYLGIYLRDQQPSTSAIVTVLKPDGSVYQQYNEAFTVYYSASYWYWGFTLPNDIPLGIWTLRCAYSGQTVDHKFVVTNKILPLTLTRFTGEEVKGNVLLHWQTTAEVNIDQMEVQKNIGASGFTTIGTQAAEAGAGNATHTYSFTDAGAFAENFYRLKIIDKNGNFTYSNIIKVAVAKSTNGIKLLSNPIAGSVSFVVNGFSGKGNYRIIDMNGKMITSGSSMFSAGQRLDVNAAGLAAGNYLLVVNVNNQHFTARFLKGH